MSEGGVSLEEHRSSNNVGGLAVSSSEVQSSSSESKQLEPEDLLKLDEIKVDDLFGLDKDKVYGSLHRLQSLPEGNPVREKAMIILGVIEEGKESYLEKNPGAEVVDLKSAPSDK